MKILVNIPKKVFTFTIAGLAAVTLFATMPNLVMAQTADQTVQEPRCTVAKARLTARSENVTTITEAQTTTYTRLKGTLDAIVTRATDRGYDTTDLVKAQEAVQTGLVAYTDKSTAYKASLAALIEAACGESRPAYNSALQASRTALKEVRTATSEVRQSIRTQAIPALKDYAAWLQTQAEANPEEGQST